MRPGSERSLAAVGAATAAAVLLTATACGPSPPSRLDPMLNRLPLDAWVTVLGGEAGARPCVRVAAPHRSLIFRRDGEQYHSGLEVKVVARRGDRQVGGGVGEGRVTVGSFEATAAATPLEVTAPLLIRGEDEVKLEVMVRVLDSSRRWRRQLAFSPRALAAMPVWIASVRPVPAPRAGGDLVVEAEADSLGFAVSLRRRDRADWPASGLALVSEATGAATGELALTRRPVPDDLAPGEARAVPVVWPASELPFGRCRLQMIVELARGDEWVRLPHEPALELINLQVALERDDAWRRQLDWLEGVLDEARLDSLGGIPAAGRAAAWRDLWRDLGLRRGQTAAAAERTHLLRVVAADDRFGGHGRGAESDRGRALIRWGEPARIESFADSRAAGAVWEVWEYPERGWRLFFFDAYGLGDYRLRREEAMEE